VLAFRDARDWKRFHDPKDMALSLVLEAAELMEHVQWRKDADLRAHLARRRGAVGDELSDVLYWVLLLAHDLGIDLGSAFERKMRANARKYPVAAARGRAAKYTELERRPSRRVRRGRRASARPAAARRSSPPRARRTTPSAR
jgi:NTP pyrophosphatase (non-canonical NTP hydrolase)